MFNFGVIAKVINTKLIKGNLFSRQRMQSSWNGDAKFQTAGLPLVIQLSYLSTPQLLLLTPGKGSSGSLSLGLVGCKQREEISFSSRREGFETK